MKYSGGFVRRCSLCVDDDCPIVTVGRRGEDIGVQRQSIAMGMSVTRDKARQSMQSCSPDVSIVNRSG